MPATQKPAFGIKPPKEADETYFTPTRRIAWLIANTKYDVVREDPGKEKFLDITPAQENAATVAQFLRDDLKFDDIHPTYDATYDDMSAQLKKIKNQMKAASESDEKLYVFVFYAGHGVMQNHTMAVLNEK